MRHFNDDRREFDAIIVKVEIRLTFLSGFGIVQSIAIRSMF